MSQRVSDELVRLVCRDRMVRKLKGDMIRTTCPYIDNKASRMQNVNSSNGCV